MIVGYDSIALRTLALAVGLGLLGLSHEQASWSAGERLAVQGMARRLRHREMGQ